MNERNITHYLKSFNLKQNHKPVEVEFVVDKVVDIVLFTIVGVETIVADVVPLTVVDVGTGVNVIDVDDDDVVAVVVVIFVVADVIVVVVSMVVDVLSTIQAMRLSL